MRIVLQQCEQLRRVSSDLSPCVLKSRRPGEYWLSEPPVWWQTVGDILEMKGRNASPEHDVEMNGWNGYVSSDLSPTPSGPRTRASQRKTVKESKTDDPHESIPPPLPGIGGALKKNLKKKLKDFHRGTTFEKILQRTSSPALGARSNLTVPSWFIKEHGDKLRQSMILRSAATKKKWTVHLGLYYSRNVAQVKFYAGWRDFACSNGLGEGDLLVFCLREDSHFDVYMHRKADAPSLGAPSSRRRHSKLLMRPGTQTTVSEMLIAKDPATRYDAIPNLISSSEDYPCFIKRIVITNLRDAQGYASGASLEIPNWFATTYYMHLRTSVQLQGFSKGNPVLIVACKATVQQKQTRLYLRAGWSSFVSDNKLRLGQVLVFTLTAYSFFVVKKAPAS